MAFINESDIEEADIQHLEDAHGYRHLNAWEKKLIGRRSLRDVVLLDVLTERLRHLNPHLPQSCLDTAVEELTKDRRYLDETVANKEIYQLITQGVPVAFDNAEGREERGYVRVIDWEDAERNDFLVVSQLSIEYLRKDNITRRPDLLLYVNGLPLAMVELKNATVKVKSGYDGNLQTYREDIPQLFWYNQFTCISNGHQTRVGSYDADWGHFFTWVKMEDTAVNHHQASRQVVEAEGKSAGSRLSLRLFTDGLCRKETLLDYVENFVLFHNDRYRIIAKNHQYLGVNNAIEGFKKREGKMGKLGVFWHTQGSGKSYSMIFFCRKLRQKLMGDWSFLIVTDRTDLDDQIYRNFKDTGTVVETNQRKENYYRPASRKQMREYLQGNRSFVFSLIHKFGIEKGKTFPQLSERENWVVIVDEAHRTQYKDLGENLRIALPKAQYIAFTGTPLLRSELTRDWFGPYVSEYNFAQSIEDGATVPLYYKKSVPRVEQVEPDLVGKAADILEEENLNEEQKQKLDREYSTLLQIVRRDDRLNEIAKHIVQHFPYRLDVQDDEGKPKPMKAMVVSIDKFTAVRMFEKVQFYLGEEIKDLLRKASRERDPEMKARHLRAVEFMRDTKMAAVISQEGTDEQERKKFAAEGLDITPHRKLLADADGDGQNIEDYFKEVNNRYRIVFVTAMWLTGFDAPAVSTLYLDKPLQNHTLMQAIARANRVLEGKKNGLVVDYFGVFRKLKKALASYAEGSKGKDDETGEFPVQEFDELLDLLRQAIVEAKAFCLKLGADMEAILAHGETAFSNIELFRDYADLILKKDDYKKDLGLFVNTINSLYDSAKPEIYDFPKIKKERDVFEYLRKVVERLTDQDEAIARAKKKIDKLLDQSVVGKKDLENGTASDKILRDPGSDFKIVDTAEEIDLSRLDFEKLRAEFPQKKHQALAFADLRSLMEIKLRQMLAQNKTRGSFLANFQRLIDDYNSGSLSLEAAYRELLIQAKDLNEEQQRAAKNSMTEREQELFDLLRKDSKLTQAQEKEIRLAAKSILEKIQDSASAFAVHEWHKDQRTRELAKDEIADLLAEKISAAIFGRRVFSKKVDVVFQHIYEQVESGGRAQA